MDNKAFDNIRIAQGYAKRPWIHKDVIKQLICDYPQKLKYRNGLDVGCGAGLSTKALKLITDKVTATDISEAMIAVCKNNFKEHNIQFYCAKAEDTCIPSEPYDIVTVAGVISWVDKRLFFNKMNEVMSDNGLLVIYDFWITNTMENNKMYKDWYDNHYLKEFPKPKRNEEEIIIEEFTKELMFEKKVIYKTVYEFALKEFVDFMMIQSNVNVTIEKGNKNIEDVSEWMYKTLKPIFEGEKRNLVFEGYSWYLKKTN